MRRTLRCVYLNVKEGQEPQILEIEDSIDVYHKLLDCDTIDIPMRTIYGKPYRIIVDDNGALSENRILSCFPPLYGNLIILGFEDDYGDLTSLSEKDCVAILTRFFSPIIGVPSIGEHLLCTD